jgi:energy-coupling factor transport system substrate-specific component
MAQAATSRLPQHVSATQVVMIVALCAALNVFGGFLAKTLAIPVVYLDTIGTFVAAVLLGPWWGAAAGVSYNVVASVTFDPGTAPFAVVSIVVALLWGYGIRTFGLGRSAASFLGLGIVVAVVSAIAASPIVLWLYGGATGSASDAITFLFELVGLDQGPSVFFSNLVSNAADKLIAGSIGLALVRALPETYLVGLRLPAESRFGLLGTAAVGAAIGVAFAAVALLWPKAA